jgi:hypothetical protein
MASKRVDGDKTLDYLSGECKGSGLVECDAALSGVDTVVSEESGVSFCVVDVTCKITVSYVEFLARFYHTALRDVPEGRNLVWAEAYHHYRLSLR